LKKISLVLIPITAVVAGVTNPTEANTGQLVLVLVLFFALVLSLSVGLFGYLMGDSKKTKISSVVVAFYICSVMAMSSIGSGSFKDVVIFNILFFVGFFYVKNNLVTSR